MTSDLNRKGTKGTSVADSQCRSNGPTSAQAQMNVFCNYCGHEAKLVGGEVIYPHRPDLHHLKFWSCVPCGAFVGTHADSKRHAPLGGLANAELREWRRRVHKVFDALWRRKMQHDGCSKSQARKAGYKWLAEQLGIQPKNCHIGMFDEKTCAKALDVCGVIGKGKVGFDPNAHKCSDIKGRAGDE